MLDFWTLNAFIEIQFGNSERFFHLSAQQSLLSSKPTQSGYRIDLNYGMRFGESFSIIYRYFYFDHTVYQTDEFNYDQIGVAILMGYNMWFPAPASL